MVYVYCKCCGFLGVARRELCMIKYYFVDIDFAFCFYSIGGGESLYMIT